MNNDDGSMNTEYHLIPAMKRQRLEVSHFVTLLLCNCIGRVL